MNKETEVFAIDLENFKKKSNEIKIEKATLMKDNERMEKELKEKQELLLSKYNINADELDNVIENIVNEIKVLNAEIKQKLVEV